MNKEAFEYVKSAGLIASHDVEAVEAIYPGSFDAAMAAHAPKFAGVADAKLAREHLGAFIAADLWAKRGGVKVDENIDARIQAAKLQAETFLSDEQTKRTAATAPRPTSVHPPVVAPKDDSK